MSGDRVSEYFEIPIHSESAIFFQTFSLFVLTGRALTYRRVFGIEREVRLLFAVCLSSSLLSLVRFICSKIRCHIVTMLTVNSPSKR